MRMRLLLGLAPQTALRPKIRIDPETRKAAMFSTKENIAYAYALKEYFGELKGRRIILVIYFHVSSRMKKKREELYGRFCTNQKDVDNLYKIVADSLDIWIEGRLSDDRQIGEIHVLKYWEERDGILIIDDYTDDEILDTSGYNRIAGLCERHEVTKTDLWTKAIIDKAVTQIMEVTPFANDVRLTKEGNAIIGYDHPYERMSERYYKILEEKGYLEVLHGKEMLREELLRITQELESYPFFNLLGKDEEKNRNRQSALVHLSYRIGNTRLLELYEPLLNKQKYKKVQEEIYHLEGISKPARGIIAYILYNGTPLRKKY